MDYEEHRDFATLPKHPAVTGANNICWACSKDIDDPEKVMNFEVCSRIGDDLLPSATEEQRLKGKGGKFREVKK